MLLFQGIQTEGITLEVQRLSRFRGVRETKARLQEVEKGTGDEEVGVWLLSRRIQDG